jgi:hypothetical protein
MAAITVPAMVEGIFVALFPYVTVPRVCMEKAGS